MLRLLIGTGLFLMAVGFGAAGWQAWRGLPDSSTPGTDAAAVMPERQVWMISPTGAVVPEADSRAFLVQDRFVPDRMARMVVTASLTDLLIEGEKLPAAPFREVLADIRASRLGQALCPILTQDLALSCAVHSARVVPGSVNAAGSEARFTIELAYRQDATGSELPDLGAHVLRTESIAPVAEGLPLPTSAQAALAELLAATATACAPEDRVATCRILDVSLDWAPDAPRRATARIAWLSAMPEGMTTLPPIEPPPEG
jgi:hypothetical protein